VPPLLPDAEVIEPSSAVFLMRHRSRHCRRRRRCIASPVPCCAVSTEWTVCRAMFADNSLLSERGPSSTTGW
jgi:hypothetical protein